MSVIYTFFSPCWANLSYSANFSFLLFQATHWCFLTEFGKFLPSIFYVPGIAVPWNSSSQVAHDFTKEQAMKPQDKCCEVWREGRDERKEEPV